MLNKLELSDLEDECNKININIYDISDDCSTAISCVCSLDRNRDIDVILDELRELHILVRRLVQRMVSKVNPDLNSLIKSSSKEEDSYKWLTNHVGKALDQLKQKRDELEESLVRKNIIGNVMNKSKIDSFSSYAQSILEDLIFNPLKDAISHYNSLDDPIKVEKTGDKEEYSPIQKNALLFWFIVFSYFFRSSQIVGSFVGDNATVPTSSVDIREFTKAMKGVVSKSRYSGNDMESSQVPEPAESQTQTENIEDIFKEEFEEATNV